MVRVRCQLVIAPALTFDEPYLRCGLTFYEFTSDDTLREDLRVRHMVDASGGWSVQRLRMILPEIIVKRITEIIPPSDGLENDNMVRHGAFSIADTYDATAGVHWEEGSHINSKEIIMKSLSWAKSMASSNACRSLSLYKDLSTAWQPPKENWIKINYDSSMDLSLKITAIGGVLGDSKARWITGYAMDSLVLHSMSIVSSNES
ncbi:hypothetical protein PVK06_038813 [Gossypium arboreum]|uniref:Uncharacterized protein n=1 Tax=Gossypium arboreum TaxID=29729 RepID=A0ABR0N336_GOSAR|nr:hypothetical protein PVK06_038813 [Gossypium arboreum]